MIGRLTGNVVAEEEEGAIVVDVSGVGYEVLVPIGTLGRASIDAAGQTTLYVHTHVREDALSLFGFATGADRLAFRTLIGVSNVGPKTAIAVLSALPAGELARAIAAKDLGKLTGISGIGKKTAERLILELCDKLPVFPATPGAPPPPRAKATIHGTNGDRLASALVNMGYRQVEADRAIGALVDRLDDTPMPDLLRDALALLAK